MRRLLLVDGHYYVYRSYFAIQHLSNSRGEPTNAIYGFAKTLRKMIKDLQPALGAVLWDEGLAERRTTLQPAYKAQRPDMPADMAVQLGTIRALVPLLGLHSLGLAQTEADDLMASYTCAAVREGIEVVLATNDKDLFQLVDDTVRVYSTNKTDLASPKDSFALLGADHVLRKWGVPPAQIGEVLCLIGDSVDNIPGVPGLGPKRAAALLQQFGNLEALLARLDEVPGESVREKIAAARAQVAQNREMVRLDTDLPLPVTVGELRLAPRYPELMAEIERLEFRGLFEEIRQEAGRAGGFTGPAQGELF